MRGTGLLPPFLLMDKGMAERQIIFDMTTAFGGKYPDVRLSPDVDFEALKTDDQNPFFVTLPVGEVGVWSRNGRRYPREAVQAIERAINEKRVTGIEGHMRDSDRPYSFQLPSIYWVGAQMEGNVLWAKGYIPQTRPDLREYYRNAMRFKMQVGTSIYGTIEGVTEDGDVVALDVEQIDIAHPARVGVPMTAAVPHLSAEMQGGAVSPADDNSQTSEGRNMGENTDKKEAPAATPTTPQQAPAQVVGFTAETVVEMQRGYLAQIAELQNKLAAAEAATKPVAELRSVLGVAEGADLLAAARAVVEAGQKLAAENVELLKEAVKARVQELVKLESARPLIEEMVLATNPQTREQVVASVQAVLERDSVKTMLKSLAQETMGPAQKRPAREVAEETETPDTLVFIP